ncbi:MAG: DUF721 domain-containing protein, partial [Pseudomonadota bacterium]
YAAVGKIRITQTAPTGFAEPKAGYDAPPKKPMSPSPKATKAAASVGDADLRRALETLGGHVYSKSNDQDPNL